MDNVDAPRLVEPGFDLTEERTEPETSGHGEQITGADLCLDTGQPPKPCASKESGGIVGNQTERAGELLAALNLHVEAIAISEAPTGDHASEHVALTWHNVGYPVSGRWRLAVLAPILPVACMGTGVLGTRFRPQVPPVERGHLMSATDKARNTAEKAKGKAQKAAGKVTGDREQEAKGRATEAKSDVKQSGEKIKDAVKDVTDKAEGTAPEK